MSVLIKRGRIITAADDYVGDVYVEGERIAMIGESLDVDADRVIDAAGKYVLPGCVDPHTHLDMKVVGELVRSAYDLGGLGAGERAARLYARHGWLRWAGPTWTISPEGPVRTEADDGSVHVLPTPTSPDLELSEPIACDWRPGDVW